MKISAIRIIGSSFIMTLAGCGFVGIAEKPGTTEGEILVSGPSVDTRERLINDRETQYYWLSQQLKNSDEAVFDVNGSRNRNSATLFAANVNAKFDPATAALAAAETANRLANIKNTGKLDELDGLIELQRRKLILKNAESEVDPSKVTAPTGSAGNSAPITSSVPPALAADAPKVSADANKAVIDAMVGALAPSSAAKLSQTPTDTFRDRLALREEIRNEMIASGLDDRHDIRGNALYRMSFDATVLPGNDTSAWAVISVCVQRPGDDRCKTSKSGEAQDRTLKSGKFDTYDAVALKRAVIWDFAAQKTRLFNDLELRTYEPKMATDLNKLNKRSKYLILIGSRLVLTERRPEDVNKEIVQAMANNLSVTAQQKNMVRGGSELKNTNVKILALTENVRGQGAVDLDDLVGDLGAVCAFLDPTNFSLKTDVLSVESDLLQSACTRGGKDGKLLLLKYLGLVGLMSDTKDDLMRNSDGTQSERDFFSAHLSPKPAPKSSDKGGPITQQIADVPAMALAGGMLRLNLDFTTLVAALKRDSLEIYAYGATPKESVQRISDVVSRREGVQLALGLQALAGNVGVSALTNFMNVNEGIFNALRRQPLVVGFGHSSANSPAPDGIGRSDFGWIIGPRYGTHPNGKTAQFRQSVVQNGLSAIVSIPGWWDKAEVVINRYWVKESGKFGVHEGGEQAVRLSEINYTIAVPGSFADALNVLNGDSLTRVNQERIDSAAWKVKIGAPAEIMIRGKSLWRNPQVRLGSQFADRVKVMPDMDGVVAIFNTVTESFGAPLSIDGVSTPKNTVPVTIATPAGVELVGYAETVKDPTPPKKLTIEGGAVLIGRSSNEFNLNLPLPGYFDIKSRYRLAGSSKAFATTNASVSRPKAEKLKYQADGITLKSGEPIELQLLLTHAKGDEAEILSVDGEMVFYSSEKDWKVSVTSISSNPAEPKDGPAIYTLSLKFPPSYAKAMGSATGKVSFSVDGKPELGTFDCVIAKDTCRLEMSLPAKVAPAGLSLNPVGLKENNPNPVENPLKVASIEAKAAKAPKTKQTTKAN